jgi:MYXO-CTERM domain-containing protein
MKLARHMEHGLPAVCACALLILTASFAFSALGAASSSTLREQGEGSSPLTPFVSEGGNTAIACDDVDTCTTHAITNVLAGDTLVVVVTEFTTSAGAPSSVEEVTSGGDHAMTLEGATPCIAGSGHGVTAIYGLPDVGAQASVTFLVDYPADEYYTIHALDVQGVAASPFETAGAGVCSTASGTTATATVSTSVPDDLVILGVEVRASTAISATGGDFLVNDASTTGADLDSGGILDEIDSSTGSISLSATFTSASWSAIAVGLKSSPLLSGTVSPPNATIDAGQTVVLSTTPAIGGTLPITYQWYSTTASGPCNSGIAISGETGQSYSTPSLAVGTYSYCVGATDSSTPTPQTVYSNIANITVNPALSVSITPEASSIDYGQTIQLTANPTGGTLPESFAWYSGATCSGTVLAVSQQYTTSSLTSGATFCAAVTDNSTFPVTATATASVTVSSSPLTVSITPGSPAVDSGQTVQLTANPSGGTSPDSYAWYEGSTCSGSVISTTEVYTTSALTTNTEYCVAVTDSASSPATATATAAVAVSTSPLTVAITPKAPTIKSGQTIELTATPTGGSGTDTYAWYAGSTCSGAVLARTQMYVTPALSATATYCVAATDSATLPVTATAGATVTVSPGTTSPSSSPTDVYPVAGVIGAILLAALLLALLARRRRKVNFTETGLPPDTAWSLTFDGVLMKSTGASILVSAKNGTHGYAVQEVTGYSASPPKGSIEVGKDSPDVKISFAPRTS